AAASALSHGVLHRTRRAGVRDSPGRRHERHADSDAGAWQSAGVDARRQSGRLDARARRRRGSGVAAPGGGGGVLPESERPPAAAGDTTRRRPRRLSRSAGMEAVGAGLRAVVGVLEIQIAATVAVAPDSQAAAGLAL